MRLRNIVILLLIFFIAGGAFYVYGRPKPPPPKQPRLFVWLVEMEELRYIDIRLPREGKSQAFVLGDDRYWHFDDEKKSAVDKKRWGGGIPLLMSGPGADRVIERNATEERLSGFGLKEPRMRVLLTLTDNRTLDIAVGDETPVGNTFYVKAPDSNDVATVDISWYQVIERLVKEPPYETQPAAQGR